MAQAAVGVALVALGFGIAIGQVAGRRTEGCSQRPRATVTVRSERNGTFRSVHLLDARGCTLDLGLFPSRREEQAMTRIVTSAAEDFPGRCLLVTRVAPEIYRAEPCPGVSWQA